MDFQLKIDAASVVLRGPFAPEKFHPGWFTANGLINPDAMRDCSVEIISPDIARFWFEWVRFDIQKDRFAFQIKDTDAFSELLQDLVVGTLEIAENTQVGAMGINRDMHFLASSLEKYIAVGDAFAPKDIWRKLGLDKLGLQSMIMESKREAPPGHIWTKLEVSDMFGRERGIHFDINNHYENQEKKTENVIAILKDRWKSDIDQSLTIAKGLLELGC